MYYLKNNLFFHRVLRIFGVAPKATGTVHRLALKLAILRHYRGVTKVEIIAVLVIFCVIISGVMVIMKRNSGTETDSLAKSEVVEIERGSTIESHAETEHQSSLEERQPSFDSLAKAEQSFAKARKALEEGEYEIAEELAFNAIVEKLMTVKENRGEDGSIVETYDQAKEKALPALKEMWDFSSKIREQNKIAKDSGSPEEQEPSEEQETPEEQGPTEDPEPPEDPDLSCPPPFTSTQCRCIYECGYSPAEILGETDFGRLEEIFFGCVIPCQSGE